MRKTLLAVTATAALALVGVPAYAQTTTTPASPSCAEALTKFQAAEKKLVKLPLTVDGAPLSGAALDAAVEADKRVVDARTAVAAAQAALDAAKVKLAAAIAADNALVPPATVDSAATVQAKADVEKAEGELATAKGALTATRAAVNGELGAKPTAAVPNPALEQAKKDRDAAKVAADTACKGETGAPGQPGAPGAPGAATPPAGFVDLDCGDFPNRAAAQAKLDETPGADPHRLDADNDRLACEVDETENIANPTPATPAAPAAPVVNTDGGGFTQVGGADVPAGGVDTGA